MTDEIGSVGNLKIELAPRNLDFAEPMASFMASVDQFFDPPIGSRVDLNDYVRRLVTRAEVFRALDEEELVGLAACYANDTGNFNADLSYIAVLPRLWGRGVGEQLIQHCLERARQLGMRTVTTKTPAGRNGLVEFYTRQGFVVTEPLVRQSGGLTRTLLLRSL